MFSVHVGGGEFSLRLSIFFSSLLPPAGQTNSPERCACMLPPERIPQRLMGSARRRLVLREDDDARPRPRRAGLVRRFLPGAQVGAHEPGEQSQPM